MSRVPMHDRDLLVRSARRLLDLHEAGTTTMADDVFENPLSVYLDPDRFDRERRAFFRDRPLIAGLSAEIPDPGSFKVFDAGVAPVLVVRGDDGTLRAFLNVCRHRGAPIAEGTGCTRRFTCKYHAWTYDTDGDLVGVPGSEGFSSMDRSARGMVPVPVEERHGIVWIVANPEHRLDLDSHLGDLDAELSHLGLDQLSHVGTRELPTACNWHVAMDTHTESYHFGYLHANSIGPFTMHNLNIIDTFGQHQRLGFGAASLPMLLDQPEDDWDPSLHIQFVYLIFPNCSLLVTGDHCELFQILPGPTVDTSTTFQSYYNREPLDSDAVVEMTSTMFDLFHGVVRDEDYPCAEEIQAGLASGANSSLVFGRNEPALHHLHRSYEAVLGSA